MYSSVGDKLFQKYPCYFSLYRLKAGKGDSLGCIINNKIHACNSFNGTDISSFTAYDSALHFVTGQRYDRYCRFTYMISSNSLDSKGNYLSCCLFCFIACFLFKLNDLYSLFMCKLIIEVIDNNCFCLFGGKT